jgi:16S rRNA (guanine(966)-N(2))-methyltransferase RsmD
MRIISGMNKGTVLEGFSIDGTRPTMDRVKESLFATISPYIENSTALDLFAGSGSLGLEAISNGASKVYFVDYNKVATKTVNRNIEKMKIEDKTQVLTAYFDQALETLSKQNVKFDIIFLDPPYRKNLIGKSLDLIWKYNMLNKGGIIVCEYEKEIFENGPFELLKEKKYGPKNIKILINK